MCFCTHGHVPLGVWACLWAVVCNIQSLAQADLGSRVGMEQSWGRWMPGSQGLQRTDRQLAPAIWLPQWVQKACPELDLFWKFKFYSPVFPKALRDFTVSDSAQLILENETTEHIFQTLVCQIFGYAGTELEGFMPLGKAHKKVWC